MAAKEAKVAAGRCERGGGEKGGGEDGGGEDGGGDGGGGEGSWGKGGGGEGDGCNGGGGGGDLGQGGGGEGGGGNDVERVFSVLLSREKYCKIKVTNRTASKRQTYPIPKRRIHGPSATTGTVAARRPAACSQRSIRARLQWFAGAERVRTYASRGPDLAAYLAQYLAQYLALLVDPLLAVARPVDDLVRVRAMWLRC